MKVAEKLILPCGAILPNRLAKSAMSENMARPAFYPGKEFVRSYRTWAEGGTGLCISGNVMVDSKHLGEANNVVIEEGLDNRRELEEWAKSTENCDSSLWVQLNHPGKQTPRFLTKEPVAPSATGLRGSFGKLFNEPRELSEREISDIIGRFSYAARMVKDCGFGGVQIHGAHGYLVNQFLSPRHNQRTDQWGGCLENRMRFVTEVYRKIREEVGNAFPIGIKLNAADFSKGGFSHAEAVTVAKALSELGVDLIELSGGSYEAPVMTGTGVRESTKKREAYFLEYAKDIKKVIKCPLMVTGGFRTGEFINESLEQGSLDVVGLGRSLCLNPNFSREILEGENVTSDVRPLSSGLKILDSMFPLEIIWYTMQIRRMGEGKSPDRTASVYWTILRSIMEGGLAGVKRVRG